MEIESIRKARVHPYVFPGLKKDDFSFVTYVDRSNVPIKKKYTPEMLQQEVCRQFGVTLSDIETKCREMKYTFPRQAYYYLMRRFTKLTYVEIGQTLSLKQ